MFSESGISFYVCPGTSSWNTIGGRVTNSYGNLKNAAENGLNNGKEIINKGYTYIYLFIYK